MRKTFEKLTSAELSKLRKEIILNSLYVSDYENSFGFDANDICCFFDGYVSYLEELAKNYVGKNVVDNRGKCSKNG